MTAYHHNLKTGPLPPLAPEGPEPFSFHRKLPGYAPSPLVSMPKVASRLGLGRILVKNESSRLGLPSFKLLGASWATYRALEARLDRALDRWTRLEELAAEVSSLKPFLLAAATDGNHGRAVARMARLLGFGARIFVPRGTALARIRAIESEGASVIVVDGDYDAAIERSAKEANERCLVIDDTSWPGYDRIPRWVIQGYGTIFREIEEQIAFRPSAVFVPIGVGALGAAAVDFYKREGGTVVVGVEPERVASVLASLRAGALTTVPGPHDSIMAGLNCGTPSSIAFPTLLAGLDAAVAIEDSFAERAMRTLASNGVVAGETGAASLGGLEALLGLPEAPGIRSDLGLDGRATVLLLVTEGATDPESYERIVGRRPNFRSC